MSRSDEILNLRLAGQIPYGALVVEPCTEGLRVTVAPLQYVAIYPHPSGIPGLPPVVLGGGATVVLPVAEAERLYQSRVVLNMVTGKVKPPDPPAPEMEMRVIRHGMSEEAALEKYDRELAAEKASRPDVYGTDRERQRPVRVVSHGGQGGYGSLPPGSWPSPPDVGF